MSDSDEAAKLATALFNNGRTITEVLNGLSEPSEFDAYNFYENDRSLYMVDDDNRFPAVRICVVPKKVKTKAKIKLLEPEPKKCCNPKCENKDPTFYVNSPYCVECDKARAKKRNLKKPTKFKRSKKCPMCMEKWLKHYDNRSSASNRSNNVIPGEENCVSCNEVYIENLKKDSKSYLRSIK